MSTHGNPLAKTSNHSCGRVESTVVVAVSVPDGGTVCGDCMRCSTFWKSLACSQIEGSNLDWGMTRLEMGPG